MKKILLASAFAAMALPMMAQETYENTKLVDNDLNGTARYVGMGGAMEALGADISTMSTNPAGIGLFRKSQISASASVVMQADVEKFDDADKTNFSFDQIGLVYSRPTGTNSFLNIGFNYHKSRNFRQILNAAGSLSNASQNKLTYKKAEQGVFTSTNDLNFSMVDDLYMSGMLYNSTDQTYYYYPATSYTFGQATKGYIGEYDFNISGNIHDRVYLGVTFGIHDVNYRHYAAYLESLASNEDGLDYAGVEDVREIDGTGFDIKAGVIFRPVENSPFRIGTYINTPTWYDLTLYSSAALIGGTTRQSASYDYKVYTPWKFGLSLGHTVGNFLALGATVEYADYSSMSTRIIDGSSYDWYYDAYYESSSADERMNDHTDYTLKGVATVKLGGEVKVAPEWALRLGYNYVSPMYDENGSKDGTLYSPGTYYETQTAYVNWKSTNRITCGVGYQHKNFSADLAYQYSGTNGDFYPFMNYYENGISGTASTEDNTCGAVDVSNKRHQILLTLGYRF